MKLQKNAGQLLQTGIEIHYLQIGFVLTNLQEQIEKHLLFQDYFHP